MTTGKESSQVVAMLAELRIAVAMVLVLVLHCSSWGSFWQVDPALAVVNISPVDNSQGNATQATVTVTFNTAVAAVTVTTNTSDTLCSGSVQISVTDFVSCIRMPTATLNSDGTVLTLGHTGIPNGQTAKIRVTSSVTSAKGKAIASEYTSGGFKTVNPPCGTGNCMTGATALGFTLGNGANVFQVQSGVHAGKYMIIRGAGSQTNIYDPLAQTFSAGPNTVTAIFGGAYNMPLSTGPRQGQTLVVTAGGGATIDVYDPSANSFSVYSASSNYAPNNSCFALRIDSGVGAGKYLMVTGNSTNTSERLDPVAGTITANASFAANAGNGASAFRITTGALSGKILVIAGGGTANTFTVSEATFAIGSGPAIVSGSPNTGSRSFRISEGANAGKFIVHLGAGSTTNVFDPAVGTFAIGSALANSVATGSSVQPIGHGANFGNFLVTMGGGQAFTNIFNSSTLTYSSAIAPSLPFNVASAPEFSFVVEGGLYPGSIFIAGGASAQYALYFP